MPRSEDERRCERGAAATHPVSVRKTRQFPSSFGAAWSSLRELLRGVHSSDHGTVTYAPLQEVGDPAETHRGRLQGIGAAAISEEAWAEMGRSAFAHHQEHAHDVGLVLPRLTVAAADVVVSHTCESPEAFMVARGDTRLSVWVLTLSWPAWSFNSRLLRAHVSCDQQERGAAATA